MFILNLTLIWISYKSYNTIQFEMRILLLTLDYSFVFVFSLNFFLFATSKFEMEQFFQTSNQKVFNRNKFEISNFYSRVQKGACVARCTSDRVAFSGLDTDWTHASMTTNVEWKVL